MGSTQRGIWESTKIFFKSTSNKQLERKIVRLKEKATSSEAVNQQRLSEIPSEITFRNQELTAEKAKDPASQNKTKINELETKLANLKEEKKILDSCISLAPSITPIIEKAKNALDSKRIQEGWALIHEAELLYYRQLSPSAIRAAAAKILFNKAEKLSEENKKAVRSLIGKTDDKGNWSLKPKNELEREDIIRAVSIVHEHYEDKYTVLDMAQKQLIYLGLIGGLVFVPLILCLLQVPDNSFSLTTFAASNLTANNVNATFMNPANSAEMLNWTSTVFNATSFTASNVTAFQTTTEIAGSNIFFWLTIAFFGILGGSVSGILSIKEAFSSKGDIPEKVLNGWITIARPLVGLLVSVAISVFLLSGLFSLVDTTITKYVMFAIAFASGFTERYIVGAVKKQTPSEE